MTNTELLEDKIAQSGKKKAYLAKKCGLSAAGFRNCVKNKAEWRASQISILCSELDITTSEEKELIFFAVNGS